MRSNMVCSCMTIVTFCTVLLPSMRGDACEISCFIRDLNITEMLADCSNQNLADVPEDLPENITYLNLVANNISQLNGTIWSRYKLLKGLSLAYNKIEKLEQSDFQGLEHLEMLDLSLNRIRYTNECISEDVFSHLTKLNYLDLKQYLPEIWANETYPQAIWNLQNLRTLMIDGLDAPLNASIRKDEVIPKLNELYFSGEYGRCQITSLPKSYFEYVPNVQHLFLSQCSIKSIEPCPFGGLSNIKSLDLSFNTNLGLNVFANITCIGTIKQLNLNSLYDYKNYDSCSSISTRTAQYLYNTPIELFTLEKNFIVRAEDLAAQYFPSTLKYLSISDNLFLYGTYVEGLIERNSLKNLLYFDSSRMYQTHITKTWTPKYILPYRKFKIRPMRNKQCIQINEEEFLSKCDNMFIRKQVKDYFQVIRERIRIDGNDLPSNDSAIQYLDISQNQPDTYKMVEQLFRYAPHLTFLNASNNYLGYPLLTDENLFKNLPKLQTLDICNNQLIKLRFEIFKNLKRLGYLYLANNRITNISFDISELKYLVFLDLQANHLEEVGKLARDTLDKLTSNNITIDISNNPIKCSCTNQEFVMWLQTTKVKFDNLDDTNCTFDNGTQVPINMLNYDAFYLSCSPPMFNLVILITSLGLVSFVIIVSCGILYRYKWNLRYLYYMTKFRLVGGYQLLENTPFEKDVFVSYANGDSKFICQYVVPELEEKGNISLLVHDRDFRAGELVADNIMRAITTSRKTLVILTHAYIRSKWCMYEMNMARMEAADTGRNVLCVILKEDVPTKYLPVEVIDIIKKKTYLEFPESEEHLEGFWERLRATLRHET